MGFFDKLSDKWTGFLERSKEKTADEREKLAKYGGPAAAGIGALTGGPFGALVGTTFGTLLGFAAPGTKKEKAGALKTTVATGIGGGILTGLFGSLSTTGLLGNIFGVQSGGSTAPSTGEPVAAGSGESPTQGAFTGFQQTYAGAKTGPKPGPLESIYGNIKGGLSSLWGGITQNATDGTAAGPDANASAARQAQIVAFVVRAGMVVGAVFLGITAIRYLRR